MGKNLEPKCKQCRRTGEKLFLRGERCKTTKCAMVKRNYPPGFHGPKQGSKKRMSDYGERLNEKQKGKKQYNLLEKQFKITFYKARKKSGDTGENFIQLLETRLDNVIYRSGVATSRAQARQFVNHGQFTVNNKAVKIPSYVVKAGDVVKIKSNKKTSKIFKDISEKLKNFEFPGWLSVDLKDLSIKVLRSPEMKEVNSNFNMQMIIEYYSK
ncbi:MAG: 30S ribosomal protein S4 [bacterium]